MGGSLPHRSALGTEGSCRHVGWKRSWVIVLCLLNWFCYAAPLCPSCTNYLNCPSSDVLVSIWYCSTRPVTPRLFEEQTHPNLYIAKLTDAMGGNHSSEFSLWAKAYVSEHCTLLNLQLRQLVVLSALFLLLIFLVSESLIYRRLSFLFFPAWPSIVWL